MKTNLILMGLLLFLEAQAFNLSRFSSNQRQLDRNFSKNLESTSDEALAFKTDYISQNIDKKVLELADFLWEISTLSRKMPVDTQFSKEAILFDDQGNVSDLASVKILFANLIEKVQKLGGVPQEVHLDTLYKLQSANEQIALLTRKLDQVHDEKNFVANSFGSRISELGQSLKICVDEKEKLQNRKIFMSQPQASSTFSPQMFQKSSSIISKAAEGNRKLSNLISELTKSRFDPSAPDQSEVLLQLTRLSNSVTADLNAGETWVRDQIISSSFPQESISSQQLFDKQCSLQEKVITKLNMKLNESIALKDMCFTLLGTAINMTDSLDSPQQSTSSSDSSQKSSSSLDSEPILQVTQKPNKKSSEDKENSSDLVSILGFDAPLPPVDPSLTFDAVPLPKESQSDLTPTNKPENLAAPDQEANKDVLLVPIVAKEDLAELEASKWETVDRSEESIDG